MQTKLSFLRQVGNREQRNWTIKLSKETNLVARWRGGWKSRRSEDQLSLAKKVINWRSLNFQGKDEPKMKKTNLQELHMEPPPAFRSRVQGGLAIYGRRHCLVYSCGRMCPSHCILVTKFGASLCRHHYGGRELPLIIFKFVGTIFVSFFLDNFDFFLLFFCLK